MNTKKIKAFLILFFIMTSSLVHSREYRMGGSVIYNFTTRGIGAGLRGEFPLESVEMLEGMSLVPQLAYFPSFNQLSDFYLGCGVQLNVYKYDKWIFYTLVNASYRAWNSRDESEDAPEYPDFAIEGGIGVTRRTCVRPFLEVRLNAIGVEPNVRIGVLYSFSCSIRGAVPCPKIKNPTNYFSH
jgi:hypothetical protein